VIIATPPQVAAWIDLAVYQRIEVSPGQVPTKKPCACALLTVHV
jgi:hypothetical protein